MQFTKAGDWEACGIASMGGAAGGGAGVYFFEFRSKKADCRASFILTAGGVGAGGSLGGAVAPSPVDVAKNRMPELFSALKCLRSFSCDYLDWSYGGLYGVGVAGAYGYSMAKISAGLFPRLFLDQDVSGWSIGVGITAVSFRGTWIQLGSSRGYY